VLWAFVFQQLVLSGFLASSGARIDL